ncbi:PaaI family thioesterase [Variovorax sp. VNK109]|uniref:PaaI family thioesterase n=1 Tax=Variovorax sp. VNK109 TaxID=3400919 RepID=UPI003BFB2EE3
MNSQTPARSPSSAHAPSHSQAPGGFLPLALPPSGYLASIGPFHARRIEDRLLIGLRIEPRHCNSSGSAHGGMLLSLVDVILTVSSNFNAGLSRFLPTVSVSCDFLRRVDEGAWVQGTAEVLRVTGGHVFSQMTLEDGAGQPCLRASGVLLLRGEESPAYSRDVYLSNSPRTPA